MRLDKPEQGGDTFSLLMSAVEWKEVHELAKFAEAGIAYDTQAAYVAQAFGYVMSQTEDILRNRKTRAAFTAVDRLAAEVLAKAAASDITLRLPKEQMRQLLIKPGKAAESEDQADIVHDALPDRFPHRFPELDPSSHYYAEAFDGLLAALHQDKGLKVTRPPSWRG